MSKHSVSVKYCHYTTKLRHSRKTTQYKSRDSFFSKKYMYVLHSPGILNPSHVLWVCSTTACVHVLKLLVSLRKVLPWDLCCVILVCLSCVSVVLNVMYNVHLYVYCTCTAQLAEFKTTHTNQSKASIST